jgi:dihydroxy-acid dehydratase
MPEWGMLPIPAKMLANGVRDMVRISDARMSGTAYGTCVLHVSPESWVGGPLSVVENGDRIALDADAGRLELLISSDEMAARKARWVKPVARYPRGYMSLYTERVTQAHLGCDFDFLSGDAEVPEPEIY